MKRYLVLCLWCGLILVAAIAAGPKSLGAQPASTQPAGFTGLWKGTLRVVPSPALRERGRLGAVNNISFTIIQDDSKITGHYTCSIGTQICRNGNADNSGKIVSGRASGNNIRFSVVVTADVSNCQYSGFSPAPGRMRGGYTCYQGGGLIEQGNFEVTREGG
ncbi:MAG TPA: hypothetical protein VGH29_07425 [Candidatus Binataceae bacterium]